MGHVLLWHCDGRLPNLALMRIAAHHRALGDTVELRRGSPSRLLWDRPTQVYGSLLFQRWPRDPGSSVLLVMRPSLAY